MLPAEIFQKLTEQKKLSHAYVFSGNNTAQKNEVLESCISALGIQIADRMTIKSAEKEISIAEVRDFSSFFSMSSWISPYKAGVIYDAHPMNTEAPSAFLKLLEEPKGDTVFFLATEHPDLLLDTIRSRAQEFKFYSFGASAADESSKAEFEKLRGATLHDKLAYAKKASEAPEHSGPHAHHKCRNRPASRSAQS